ncbi:HEPN domain-containing protein [Desulfurococcaceae archaeon AG1]|nr:HEPN domain-containing protein [Desulfurococcaceae archaeon AG1]
MSLEHSKRLLEEAYKDLEIECYNKATSASYFALRKACETLLTVLGEKVPRRDDKLANAIKNKGLEHIAKNLITMYVYRKAADYGEGVSREVAIECYRLAREGVGEVESLIRSLVGDAEKR